MNQKELEFTIKFFMGTIFTACVVMLVMVFCI